MALHFNQECTIDRSIKHIEFLIDEQGNRSAFFVWRRQRAAIQVRKCLRRRWPNALPYSNRKRPPCGSTTPIGAGVRSGCHANRSGTHRQRIVGRTCRRPDPPAPAQDCRVTVVRAPPRAVTPRKEQCRAPPAPALASRPSPRERPDAPRATALPSGANCGQGGSAD